MIAVPLVRGKKVLNSLTTGGWLNGLRRVYKMEYYVVIKSAILKTSFMGIVKCS